MSARERILSLVRATATGRHVHPGAFVPTAQAASWEAFAAALATAGGQAVGPLPIGEVGARVTSLAHAWGGGRCVGEPAALSLLGPGPFESAQAEASPHSFADVAVGVAVASAAVAENGAVAVGGGLAPHRALLFLCERLVILVDAARVLPDMHAASRDLSARPLCDTPFTWVAGPSKTSDIEQTLVVGAHGPRALTVVGYREG